MTRKLILEPEGEPVSLEEAKAHLRLETEEEDGLLLRLIEAARREVEASARRLMLRQVWRLYLDAWPRGGTVMLPFAPLKSVLSVTVFDADGEAHDVPATDYLVDLAGAPGRLKLRRTIKPGRAMNGIEIDVDAGYGEPEDVPAPLRHAVLMLAAHWFENREAVTAQPSLAAMPLGLERAIAPYRVLAL